jgi:hypothetical protein
MSKLPQGRRPWGPEEFDKDKEINHKEILKIYALKLLQNEKKKLL